MDDKLKQVLDLIQDTFESFDISVMEGIYILEYMKHNIIDNLNQEIEEEDED